MAKKYTSREEAIAMYRDGDIPSFEAGDIVDMIDDKFGSWMMHPVIVHKIHNGKVLGFECTSAKGASSFQGRIDLLDWAEEGFDEYCTYHTVKCGMLEEYDIENVVSLRGTCSERDLSRVRTENERFCKYQGRGQTEADLKTASENRSAAVKALRLKAKPVIPKK